MLSLIYKGHVVISTDQEQERLEQTLKFFQVSSVKIRSKACVGVKGELKVMYINRIPQHASSQVARQPPTAPGLPKENPRLEKRLYKPKVCSCCSPKASSGGNSKNNRKSIFGKDTRVPRKIIIKSGNPRYLSDGTRPRRRPDHLRSNKVHPVSKGKRMKRKQ